jgi:hypothetical protein
MYIYIYILATLYYEWLLCGVLLEQLGEVALLLEVDDFEHASGSLLCTQSYPS